MALDAILLSGLVSELRPKLTGARIDKVQQPERDRIVLSLRTVSGNLRLLINAGAGSGRLQLTEQSLENPAEPPMFCMLLRKYLIGARINDLYQPDWERLCVVDITSRSELGDSVGLRLYVELMGRSSNLVLVGADGRIIDCLRRMDYAGDSERRLLPGMIYRLPPKQKKPLVFDCDAGEIAAAIADSDREKPLDKRLLDSFSGISPTVCRELAYRCGESVQRLPDAVCSLVESVRAGELTPTLQLRDGRPEGFSFMHLAQYGSEYSEQSCESFSALLDAYYSKRELFESRKRHSRELSHTVKTARDRIARKLALQQEELRRTLGRDEHRKRAELLTANMYRVRRGDRSVAVEDYYTEGSPELVIELDPLKTPQQNAAAMFREYTKLKTAEQHLTGLIAEGEKMLDYLNSVLAELETAESDAELADIRRELTETGCIRKQGSAKQKKQQRFTPWSFVSSDGFRILVGRNNSQNDELTLKTARRTDLWLHTKTVHGSHVIICCDGASPPERTVAEAASIAAYYSQARGGGKVAVDCTMVRNVKKPAGALPGKVIYTDYTTLIAEADETLAEKLKSK